MEGKFLEDDDAGDEGKKNEDDKDDDAGDEGKKNEDDEDDEDDGDPGGEISFDRLEEAFWSDFLERLVLLVLVFLSTELFGGASVLFVAFLSILGTSFFG